MRIGWRAVMGIVGLSVVAVTICQPGVIRAQLDAPNRATLVYQTDFSGPVGDEWSHRTTSETPKGKRKFLGAFVEEPVVLALTNLPRHELVRAAFDVFFIRSWDGNSPVWGSKVWDLSVVDGPALIHSTFCNCGFFTDNNEQSFPDPFPSVSHPAWTGAAEHQTLGYMQSWGGPERTFDTDSVYHFVLTFPHHGPTIGLRFTSIMEGKKDKSWGLANVKIETLDHAIKYDDQTMEDSWKNLGGNDPVAAFEAGWRLISSGDRAVDLIQKQVGAGAGFDARAFARLIAQLDDDDYAVREQASKALLRQRGATLPLLRQARAVATSGEVRGRLDDIIKADGPDFSPEVLRSLRVNHVLDVIRTPAALRLRDTLGAVPAENPAQQ